MTLAPITCSSCGVVFGLTAQYERSRRDDHEAFRCPNGHSQHFPGKTAEEKKIEELEATWSRVSTTLRLRDEENVNLMHELRRCPICEDVVTRAHYVDTIRPKVAEHLRDEHGARTRLRAITEKSVVAS